MKLLVVWPPLARAAHPDPFWAEVIRRVHALGIGVHGIDLDAHLADALCRPERLSPLVTPILARFEMLERKAHLSGDERRRHAALATLAPLLDAVVARVDGARRGLRERTSYGDAEGSRPVAAIGYRAVVDLALRCVMEALAFETWTAAPAALTADPAPLARLLGDGAPAWPEADAVLVAVGWETQVGFARAVAARAQEAGLPVLGVVPGAPAGDAPRELPLVSLDALDRGRVVRLAEPRAGRAAPRGGEAVVEITRAPWSSAVRLWPASLVEMPGVRALGAVACPAGLTGTPAVPAPPGAERRALAAHLGVACLPLVPVPGEGPAPRLLVEDARQLAVLGTRPPGGDDPTLRHAGVPRRAGETVLVRTRHEAHAGAGVGVGRTAREQIRGGLRRARAAPVAVSLRTGLARRLSADAVRVLDAVDGTRSVGEILDDLGGGRAGPDRERVASALAELREADVIAF